MINYRARLKIAARKHREAIETTQRARNKAIGEAFIDGGLSHQEIAELSEMSYGMIRKIVRDEKARTTRRR